MVWFCFRSFWSPWYWEEESPIPKEKERSFSCKLFVKVGKQFLQDLFKIILYVSLVIILLFIECNIHTIALLITEEQKRFNNINLVSLVNHFIVHTWWSCWCGSWKGRCRTKFRLNNLEKEKKRKFKANTHTMTWVKL